MSSKHVILNSSGNNLSITGGTASVEVGSSSGVALNGNDGPQGPQGPTGPAITPQSTFFSKLQTSTRRLERQELVAGPSSGSSITIATITGAGVMENFWIAAYNTSEIYDCLVEFYVDGEGTPSVTSDLGTLFAYHLHWATGGAAFTVGSDHITCIGGLGTGSLPPPPAGGVLRFPMPYSDGLIIKLKNVVGGSAMAFWSQVFYTTLPVNDVPPYRLKSLGATWNDGVSVTSGSTYAFMDLSDSGILVYHGMVGQGATNSSWLERDIIAVVDSTTTMQTTGLEDWFMGAFYFLGAPYSRPEAFCSRRTGNDASMGVDLAAAIGGIPFSTRLQLTLDTEAAVTTTHSMSWIALYYKNV